MKTIEQRAKAYDEAIERARQIHDADRVSGIKLTTCEEIFPELTESEDERIRKSLIDMLKNDEKCYLKEIAWLEKQSEQKSTWSKEDERIYQSIMDDTVQENQLNNKQTNWLKDIKYRYFPQQKQKFVWSEEDEKKNEDEAIRSNSIPELPSSAFRLGFKLGWFKALKEKVQPNQDWNEEDEKNINFLCELLTDLQVKSTENEIKHGTNSHSEYYYNIKKWLKSLRPQNRCVYNPYKAVVESIAAMVEKYAPFDSNLQDFYDNVKVKCKDAKEYDSLFPQSTWKPSDEQMNALKNACDKHWEPDGLDPLYTLWEQLKKLKE